MRIGVVGDVLAGDDDAAGVGLEKAHDVVQRDGLAHAAAAEDADGFRGHHIEAHMIEDDVVAEGFGDFAEFDVGRGFGISGMIGFGFRSLLALRRLLCICQFFLGVQVAEHRRRKPGALPIRLPLSLGFAASEERINPVTAGAQGLLCGVGELAAVDRAQRLPAFTCLRYRHRGPGIARPPDQVLLTAPARRMAGRPRGSSSGPA